MTVIKAQRCFDRQRPYKRAHSRMLNPRVWKNLAPKSILSNKSAFFQNLFDNVPSEDDFDVLIGKPKQNQWKSGSGTIPFSWRPMKLLEIIVITVIPRIIYLSLVVYNRTKEGMFVACIQLYSVHLCGAVGINISTLWLCGEHTLFNTILNNKCLLCLTCETNLSLPLWT